MKLTGLITTNNIIDFPKNKCQLLYMKYCIPRNIRRYNISRFSERRHFRADKHSLILNDRKFRKYLIATV